MARFDRRDRTLETVRDELRREDDAVRGEDEVIEHDELALGGDPEVPDVPLGVPVDADPHERPGFPRGDPSQG